MLFSRSFENRTCQIVCYMNPCWGNLDRIIRLDRGAVDDCGVCCTVIRIIRKQRCLFSNAFVCSDGDFRSNHIVRRRDPRSGPFARCWVRFRTVRLLETLVSFDNTVVQTAVLTVIKKKIVSFLLSSGGSNLQSQNALGNSRFSTNASIPDIGCAHFETRGNCTRFKVVSVFKSGPQWHFPYGHPVPPVKIHIYVVLVENDAVAPDKTMCLDVAFRVTLL